MRSKEQLLQEAKALEDDDNSIIEFLWGIMEEGYGCAMRKAAEISDELEPSGELGISDALYKEAERKLE